MAGEPPRVSVVLPVYNEAAVVEGAIRSILSQSFESLEVVVIDDGSTDGTSTTVEAIDDGRIRLIRNSENLGLPVALNRGIDAARGEFVARMDADDRSLPRRIERQVAAMEADDRRQVVGCWYRLIGPDGARFGPIERTHPDDVDLRDVLHRGPGIAHGSVLIRADALATVGGYREAFTYSQDLDLWLRLGRAYGPGFLAIVEEHLYERRISPELFRKVPKQRLYGEIARTAVRKNRADEETFRVPRSFLDRVDDSDEYLRSPRVAKSRFLQKAGNSLARAGESRRARRYLLESVFSRPWNVRSWYRLARTLV